MRYLSFVERYMMLKKLRNKSEYKIFDSFSGETFSSALFKSIHLPLAYLNLKELELLLKREEEKIKRDFTMKTKARDDILDILNNMLFTPNTIPQNRKGLFKKISTRHLIDAWEYYDEKEKRFTVERFKKEKIFKEDIDIDKAIETIDKVYAKLKTYSSAEYFADSNSSLYGEFEGLFESPKCEVGDGHCPYSSSFNNPDWQLVKDLRRIIKNLKTPVILEEKQEAFVGKKLNRKYVIDESCIKPFEFKRFKKINNIPNVGIIIDFSGSMRGTPEVNAKSFATALLQEGIVKEVLVKNEYFEDIVKTTQQLRSKPATGDEGFDTLSSKEYIKDKDFLIVITDLSISKNERKGLYEFVKDKNTMILCVQKDNEEEYKDDLPFRRYAFADKNDVITVAKKLTKLKV